MRGHLKKICNYAGKCYITAALELILDQKRETDSASKTNYNKVFFINGIDSNRFRLNDSK